MIEFLTIAGVLAFIIIMVIKSLDSNSGKCNHDWEQTILETRIIEKCRKCGESESTRI